MQARNNCLYDRWLGEIQKLCLDYHAEAEIIIMLKQKLCLYHHVEAEIMLQLSCLSRKCAKIIMLKQKNMGFFF